MSEVESDRVLYFSFVAFGIGVLMPWTSVLNTMDYMTAQVSQALQKTLTIFNRWAITSQHPFFLSPYSFQ